MRRWVSIPGTHPAGRFSSSSSATWHRPYLVSIVPPILPLIHLSRSSRLPSASESLQHPGACLQGFTHPCVSSSISLPLVELSQSRDDASHSLQTSSECHPGPSSQGPWSGFGLSECRTPGTLRPTECTRRPRSACTLPALGISHSLACLISTNIPGGRNNIFLSREGAQVKRCEECAHGA